MKEWLITSLETEGDRWCLEDRVRERERESRVNIDPERRQSESRENSFVSRSLCYERPVELQRCQHRLSNLLAHQQLQPTQE